MTDEKTTEDIKKNIIEQVSKVIGGINNLDSKAEKAEHTQLVLNSIIAGVDLSKIEKAGVLAYLMNKRLG